MILLIIDFMNTPWYGAFFSWFFAFFNCIHSWLASLQHALCSPPLYFLNTILLVWICLSYQCTFTRTSFSLYFHWTWNLLAACAGSSCIDRCGIFNAVIPWSSCLWVHFEQLVTAALVIEKWSKWKRWVGYKDSPTNIRHYSLLLNPQGRLGLVTESCWLWVIEF